MAVFTIATEGILDAAVARRLLTDAGHSVIAEYTQSGKTQLDPKICGFNHAARLSPWLVLRDLDHDAACPRALLDALCPLCADNMLLRIPVRAIEAWLLADHANMSRFIGVPVSAMPAQPDALDAPKAALLDIARHSRSRRVLADLVPPRRSGRSVAPGYNARLSQFVFNRWHPAQAALRSDSLKRCIAAIGRVQI